MEHSWTAFVALRANYVEVFDLATLVKADAECFDLRARVRRRLGTKKKFVDIVQVEWDRKRRAMLRELTDKVEPKSEEISSAFVSEALKRSLVRSIHEMRALEMYSRHSFASLAQVVIAIKPHLFKLTDVASANSARHEMFTEKTLTEPKNFLVLAGVRTVEEAHHKLRLSIEREARSFPLIHSSVELPVLTDGNLSLAICRFLDHRSLFAFGRCSKKCAGAIDLSQLFCMTEAISLAQTTLDGRTDVWVESVLLSRSDDLDTVKEVQLLSHVIAQKRLADCIAFFYSKCFPGESLESIIRRTRYSRAQSSLKIHNSVENRIPTDQGLFVVRRKAFGGCEILNPH